jgi:hypothetical protein
MDQPLTIAIPPEPKKRKKREKKPPIKFEIKKGEFIVSFKN